MKNLLRLIYIGTESYRHPILPSYLERELKKLGQRVKSIEFLHTLDPSIPSKIKELIDSKEPSLIVAYKDHFLLSHRIILDLGAELLSSSTTTNSVNELQDNSYLYSFKGSLINLIGIDLTQKLPKLLLGLNPSLSWHIFPKTPLQLQELQKLLFKNPDNLELVEIVPGWLKLTSYGAENIKDIQRVLKKIDAQIIPRESLVQALIDYLSAQKKKITFAESCTGGLLATTFTAKGGTSNILEGSYVSYANQIKSNWLGVREDTLIRYGAVSAECVEEMAKGAQKNLRANIAIAISGIAGPTGATADKPVGTVYICLRNEEDSQVQRLNLKGDRNAIQQLTILYTLKYLVESEKNKIFDFFSKNP